MKFFWVKSLSFSSLYDCIFSVRRLTSPYIFTLFFKKKTFTPPIFSIQKMIPKLETTASSWGAKQWHPAPVRAPNRLQDTKEPNLGAITITTTGTAPQVRAITVQIQAKASTRITTERGGTVIAGPNPGPAMINSTPTGLLNVIIQWQ